MNDKKLVKDEISEPPIDIKTSKSFGNVINKLRNIDYATSSVNFILWILAITAPMLFFGISSNFDIAKILTPTVGAFTMGTLVSMMIIFYLGGKDGKAHTIKKFELIIDIIQRILTKRQLIKSVKNVKRFLVYFNEKNQNELNDEYTLYKTEMLEDKINKLIIKNKDKTRTSFKDLKWYTKIIGILFIPITLPIYYSQNRYNRLSAKKILLEKNTLRDNSYKNWKHLDIMASNTLHRTRRTKKGRTEGKSNPERSGWILKLLKIPFQLFGINVNLIIAISIGIPIQQILQFYSVFLLTMILSYLLRFDRVRRLTESDYLLSLEVIESVLDEMIEWIEKNPIETQLKGVKLVGDFTSISDKEALDIINNVDYE
jgi:hypothetical protein